MIHLTNEMSVTFIAENVCEIININHKLHLSRVSVFVKLLLDTINQSRLLLAVLAIMGLAVFGVLAVIIGLDALLFQNA